MRNVMRNLGYRLFFLGLTLPLLGTGCLLDSNDVRDQAITSLKSLLTGLFGTAVNNVASSLTG